MWFLAGEGAPKTGLPAAVRSGSGGVAAPRRLRWPAARAILAVDSRGTAWTGASRSVGESHLSPLPLAAALDALSRERSRPWLWPRPHLTVLLGADVCVHWMQPAVGGARTLKELKAAAAAHCEGLFGAEYRDAAVMGDWNATRAFVCAAAPRALVDEIVQGAHAGGWRPFVETAALRALSAVADARPPDGWMVVRTPTRALLCMWRAARLQYLMCLPMPPHAADQQLRTHAGRTVQHLHAVLSLPPPAGTAPRPLVVHLCEGAKPAGNVEPAAIDGEAGLRWSTWPFDRLPASASTEAAWAAGLVCNDRGASSNELHAQPGNGAEP